MLSPKAQFSASQLEVSSLARNPKRKSVFGVVISVFVSFSWHEETPWFQPPPQAEATEGREWWFRGEEELSRCIKVVTKLYWAGEARESIIDAIEGLKLDSVVMGSRTQHC
ncbi:hypothetical protein LINGRAPRIM_LOCUS2503 [Linum grandiflorum]